MFLMKKFNNYLAAKLTSFVGSMLCAYLFCIIALISLPQTLKTGSIIVIISWFAQTFLQLVLLSVIMVGQNLQSQKFEEKIEHLLTKIEKQEKEELKILEEAE